MIKSLKNYFLTGLISSLPLFLTIFIMVKLFEVVITFIERIIPIKFIMEMFKRYELTKGLKEEILWKITIYGLTIFIICAIIIITGVIASHIIGKEKMKYFEELFMKIPLAKPIYTTLKQISQLAFSQNMKAYKKVVLIEYPRKGIYSLGFLTNKENKAMSNYLGKRLINIFIPTSPNPTSGMFIMVSEDEVKELDMRIEDAIKLIISGGAILPENNEFAEINYNVGGNDEENN